MHISHAYLLISSLMFEMAFKPPRLDELVKVPSLFYGNLHRLEPTGTESQLQMYAIINPLSPAFSL